MGNCKYAHLAWGFALGEDEKLPDGVDPLLRHGGVEIKEHYLNGGESEWVIVVEDSDIIACSGDGPTLVSNSQLEAQEAWRGKLVAFCEHTGIPFQEPSWVLYVSWTR
jgi:hypothetical protein